MLMRFQSLEETRKWASKTAGELFQRPCVVLLSGPLGAGKTQLVKWFLSGLGVQETSSPTFAIHQEYSAASGAVDHVDLYRLKSDADLESSGFWDLLTQPQALLFVEWADRLPESVWPTHWRKIFISIEKKDGEARAISVRTILSGSR